MNHAPYCQDFNERVEAEQREFALLWPNYCRECGATGEICGSYDPSPSGVGLSPGSMMECDPCEGDAHYTSDMTGRIWVPATRPCVEQGYCPRCAAPAIVDRGPLLHEGCSNCGWRAHESFPAPPLGECTCFEDREWHAEFDDYPPY